jgi:chromosomal replication initiator protein
MTLTQQPYNGVQIAAPYCARSLKQRTDQETAFIITKIVSEFLNIPIFQMVSQSRKREIVEARQIAMTLIKKHTNLTLKSVGGCFSGRDHSTTISAIRKVSDLCDTDKRFKTDFETVSNKVKLALIAQ